MSHNVVVGNYNGITVVDSGDRASNRPAPHGPHIVQNVWVHGNTITGFAGQTGAFEDHNDPAVFTTNHNRFDANLYYVGSLTGPRFSWANADMGWERWRGYGNDPHGRAELATTHDLKQIITDAATRYHW